MTLISSVKNLKMTFFYVSNFMLYFCSAEIWLGKEVIGSKVTQCLNLIVFCCWVKTKRESTKRERERIIGLESWLKTKHAEIKIWRCLINHCLLLYFREGFQQRTGLSGWWRTRIVAGVMVSKRGWVKFPTFNGHRATDSELAQRVKKMLALKVYLLKDKLNWQPISNLINLDTSLM